MCQKNYVNAKKLPQISQILTDLKINLLHPQNLREKY